MGAKQPRAGAFGCVCTTNRTGERIQFAWSTSGSAWKTETLQQGNYWIWICSRYSAGATTAPDVSVQLDVDMSDTNSYSTYRLPRGHASENNCAQVRREGHYVVQFRPNTNKAFIEIAKR